MVWRSCSTPKLQQEEGTVDVLNMVAVIVAAVGAINWGLVGLLNFDLVALISGGLKFGETNIVSRILYVIVALAGIWAILAALEVV